MNVHFSRAGQLLKAAVLPDRTVGRFVNAALDGSSQRKNAYAEAAKGLGQDAFELAVNPAKALVALGRGLFGK